MKLFRSLKVIFKLIRLILLLISGLILAPFFLRNGIHDSTSASRIFIWWNGAICRIFKAQITTQGKMNSDATLFIMNHISWFDIPVLASQQPLHFLSKAEVKAWILIGWLSHKAGTLFIQRGGAGAAQKSREEIIHCLQNKGSVVLFPEGTTTDGRHLKKFHARLFQAAIDAKVKIQPIALRYPYKDGINPHVAYINDMSFMDSLLGLTRSHPLKVELNFLPSIDLHLKKTEDASRQQLAQQARQAIANELGIKL